MTDAMTECPIPDDECWNAALARDRSYDGRFVSGVLSTGIYCRPSCPARHPKRENVKFFANGAAAREAGLRPCLRCSPDDVSRDERAVLSAIAAIKAAEQPLALAALAAETGYSPAHFQRVFTRATGLSPSAYGRALMAERAAQALSAAPDTRIVLFALAVSVLTVLLFGLAPALQSTRPVLTSTLKDESGSVSHNHHTCASKSGQHGPATFGNHMGRVFQHHTIAHKWSDGRMLLELIEEIISSYFFLCK